MRTKFTLKTHKILAAAALFAGLLGFKVSKAQALFEAGRTYYVNGSGVDLVAPKDTFASLGGSGAVYTGGAYTSSTGIFYALSVNGIDSNTLGQVTILLVPGYTGTETNFPLIKGVPYSSPSRPIVMKPVAGSNFNITRSVFPNNESVIRMEGTQYFTIDGEGTPGQRNLSFTSTNGPAGGHRVIDVVSNASINLAVSAINNVTIKNCNVLGYKLASFPYWAAAQTGIFIGSTSGLTAPVARRAENVSIINCNIQNVQYGIYARGVNGISQYDKGLVVRNNTIGGAPGSSIGSSTPGQAGILLHNQANVVIEANTIRDCDTLSTGFAGIYLTSLGGGALDSNVYINANKIYNLNLGVNNVGAVYGIRLAQTSVPRSQDMGYTIANNVISNISSRPNSAALIQGNCPIGISIEENTANAGVRIYNNSISMTGATLISQSPAFMGGSACIYVNNLTSGGIELVNNILSNRMTNVPGNNSAYQVFGVFVNSNSQPFTQCDNNLYDISTTGGWANVGRNSTTNYASLSEWKQFTGDDDESTMIRPVFSDPVTLQTTDGASTRYGTMGKPLVSADINGTARPSTNHSIGAYQFNQDASNAYAPLQGGSTYQINGVTSFPTAASPSTGSFRNIGEFVDYLNNFGTDPLTNDSIKIIISSGYTGDTTEVIPAVIPYPNMSATRKIVLKTAPGVSALISLPQGGVISGNSALFRLNGVSDFILDGRNPANPNNRTITFLLPTSANVNSAKVISLTATALNAVSRNVIVGCNILGSSSSAGLGTINTACGIYLGDPYALNPPYVASSLGGSNINNFLVGNFIGGVRNGIYWRAKSGGTDQLSTINNNMIGGYADGTRTNQIGGFDSQAGIYIKGLLTATLDSNVIRNNLPTSNGFRGIDLDGTNEPGKSQDLNITRNTIMNLGGPTYAIGIRIALNEAGRSVRISNNFIAKIYGAGSPAFGTIAIPTGIGIEPVTTPTDLGISIVHNTVTLSHVPGINLSPNSFATPFYIGLNVTGLRVANNIFSNTTGRNAVPNSVTPAIVFSSPATANAAFLSNQGNVYYAKGNFSYNYVGLAGSINVNQLFSMAELRSATGFDQLSIFGEVPFLNDSTIHMDLKYVGHIINNRNIFVDQIIDMDITGDAREFNTSVGALEIPPVYIPLQGGATYQVSGFLQPPTVGNLGGQFNTINNLFRYINTNGVDDDQFPGKDIIVEITGTYAGEGDTLITPLHEYPLMSSFRRIIIKPAAGATPVIASTGDSLSAFDNFSSVIRLQGAQYITIDGSNNGTHSRDLTIRMPLKTPTNEAKINNQYARVIDVVSWAMPSTGIVIKNCNISGYSNTTSISSFAGIYHGGVNFYTTAAPVPFNQLRRQNGGNTYSDNYITSVKYGIMLRGMAGIAGGQDINNAVVSNIIGGNVNTGAATPTDFFGGLTNSAGISAASQGKLLIDSNVIKNNIRTFGGNSGIELINPVAGSALGTDSAVTVSRNIINNIRTTNNAHAYGIYTNLSSYASKRSLNYVNNMISGISALGSTSLANNPYGIFLNGIITAGDLDINMYHNSINLGAETTLGAQGTSACIGLSGNINWGINLENNILQNRLTRAASGGAIYAILTQINANPFIVSDNNNYYVGGANAVNHIAGINANSIPGATNLTSFNTWVNYTSQDTLSLNYPAPFTSDSNLFIPAGTASPLYHGGRRITNVTNDVLNNPRPLLAFRYATIGAHEFTGSYADSSAPKVYDYTPVTSFCQDYLFSAMQITARVLDRNSSLTDTMYYTLNGGPELFVLPTSTNGFERIFEIPAGMGPNTFVAYRFASVDGSGKVGKFVNVDPTSNYNYATTNISNFPITVGFDLPNSYGLKVEQVSGTSGWDIHSFGSLANPFLFPLTGARAAMLPASNGSVSRIVTPCMDFENMKLPTVRLYVSQNYDNPLLNDSILIKVNFGFNNYQNIGGANPVGRVNNSFTTPGYKVYDVCLLPLAGLFGSLRLGIEGYSRGGGNLLIDSLIIFDNFVDHPVSPATQENCFNDSFKVNVMNTSSQNAYYLYDDLTQRAVGPQVIGNGGTLELAGYLSTVDSAYIKVRYINLTSGCEIPASELTNIAKVYFGTFKNGPFVKKGDQFYGVFNDGNVINPDAVRIGGTADFEIVPPGGRQNSDYGTSWTVAAVELRNTSTNATNNSVLSIIPATPSTPAYVRFTGVPADSNKLFKLSITLRLLPNGCDSILTRIVRVAQAPAVNFYAINDTLCQGFNAQFFNVTTNSVYTLPVTYTWDFGDGTGATTIAPIKRFTTPGVYKVKLIAKNSSTLLDSVSYDFVINPAPSASYTSTLPCAGKEVVFTNTSTNTPDITYTWSIAGQSFITRDVTTSIPYSDTTVNVRLIVKNGDGCTDTARLATTVFAQPSASFTADNVCAGASVQFNNSSTIAPGKNGRVNQFGSQWDFGNGDIGFANDPLYQYPAGGTYTVKLRVISNFGCTDTSSASVSIFDKPVALFTVDNTCKSSTLDIVNNSTFSGGLNNVKYNWNFGDNSPASSDAVPVKQYGEARSFFITLRVTDTVNNCVDSMTRLISVKESAQADFTASNGCVNTPVQFTNVSVVPPGVTPVFSWAFGDGGLSADASPAHAYATGGDKIVKFTVDIDGCKSIATDTISISAVQPVTFTRRILDDSSTYVFTANPGGFATYRWDFGDNSTRTVTVDSIRNTFPKGGKFYVLVVATDANGCASSFGDSVEVFRTVGIKDEALEAKFNFNLFPNPFTTSASVVFEMNSKEDVSLEIYDMLGRKVYSRNEGVLSNGKHTIEFSEADLSVHSAAYLVKVKIGNDIITRQLIKQ